MKSKKFCNMRARLCTLKSDQKENCKTVKPAYPKLYNVSSETEFQPKLPLIYYKLRFS